MSEESLGSDPTLGVSIPRMSLNVTLYKPYNHKRLNTCLSLYYIKQVRVAQYDKVRYSINIPFGHSESYLTCNLAIGLRNNSKRVECLRSGMRLPIRKHLSICGDGSGKSW